MNRDDLKEIARVRLEDARVLLENGNYEGAYYLCGYVIECGLKACIAKQTKQYDFPDRRTVNDSYTHDLTKLVGVAGLESDLDIEKKRDKAVELNWSVVEQWSEESRYQKHSEEDARDLYSAITNRRSGVLRWITQHW
jgi:HEPN domain-containing protein